MIFNEVNRKKYYEKCGFYLMDYLEEKQFIFFERVVFWGLRDGLVIKDSYNFCGRLEFIFWG